MPRGGTSLKNGEAGIAGAGAGSGTGLGDQVYEEVLDLLVSGALAPGDQVPERRLALQLGVSRTPLREALHRLEGERVLERGGDGKLTVRRITIEDVIETLQVRRILEAEAARRAAGRIAQHDLTLLRERLTRLREGGDPSVPDHRACDEDLHRLMAEHAGNRLLADLIEDLRRRTQMFSTKRMPTRFAPVCAEHIAIVDALMTGDPDAASAAVAEHLENVKASVLEKLSEL